jgi:RNA ligase
VNGVKKNIDKNYYSDDIWGAVAKEVEEQVPNGFTLYGEIVGFTSEGSQIQSEYHYGCLPKQHKFFVYRVTLTTSEGLVVELPWLQMGDFCKKYGFDPVETFYYGKASDLFPKTVGMDLYNWRDGFLKFIEETYVNGRKCKHHKGKVPAEGVVIRKDGLSESEALKSKSFEFLEKESKILDKGEVDIETAETL